MQLLHFMIVIQVTNKVQSLLQIFLKYHFFLPKEILLDTNTFSISASLISTISVNSI